MKYSISMYRRSSWATIALLTIVMIGFGVIADAHVKTTAPAATVSSVQAQSTSASSQDTLADIFTYLF